MSWPPAQGIKQPRPRNQLISPRPGRTRTGPQMLALTFTFERWPDTVSPSRHCVTRQMPGHRPDPFRGEHAARVGPWKSLQMMTSLRGRSQDVAGQPADDRSTPAHLAASKQDSPGSPDQPTAAGAVPVGWQTDPSVVKPKRTAQRRSRTRVRTSTHGGEHPAVGGMEAQPNQREI